MKNSKRILSVKIIREVDTDPDTSYLGEYSNSGTSEFSIDRAHLEDCASLESNHFVAVNKLERILRYLFGERNTLGNSGEITDWEALDEACDLLIVLQDDCRECDCGGHNYDSREYRYFNPSFNYVTKEGKLQEGETAEDVQKYVRQDYDRMESLHACQWYYVGIRAEAKIATTYGGKSTLSEHVTAGGSGPVQTICSGGLWGTESDSEECDLKEIEQEELSALRSELKALGFSTRAISAAFKNVEHEND